MLGLSVLFFYYTIMELVMQKHNFFSNKLFTPSVILILRLTNICNRYYPYYYGPFASDLRGLAGVKVEFQKDMPFRPFDQLMAVLPPKRLFI